MRTILFICTGNTCRSPLAEAIAQHWIGEGLLGEDSRYLVASAGTMAGDGGAIAQEAVRALDRLGIEHAGRTKPLTREMIHNAEVVLAMTEDHLAVARSLVADDATDVAKLHLLDPDGPIDDPIGMGQEAYDELAQRLTELIPKRLKEVLLHEDRARVGSSGS